jgi:N utilization substance protein A
MSRAHPGFLVALFEQAVTEIYDEIVTIESAARDAGYRSKIAVYSKDSSVDPVGACVGMKGQRVQSVVQELNGEKIDIIPWDSDPARLVCNALAPAAVSKVIVDENNHSMEVIVPEDQLSLAIGKRGQNVRLAAQLTGWRLDIKSEVKLEKEMTDIKDVLAEVEGLGVMRAGILVNEGVTTPEELSKLSARALMRTLNLEQEEAEKIIENAKKFDYSTVKKLSSDEAAVDDETKELLANASAAPVAEAVVGGSEQASDVGSKPERVQMFLKLSGVGEAMAQALAEAGYGTIGDVIADSVEEVSAKTGFAIGVARTVQIAADKYLQAERVKSKEQDED